MQLLQLVTYAQEGSKPCRDRDALCGALCVLLLQCCWATLRITSGGHGSLIWFSNKFPKPLNWESLLYKYAMVYCKRYSLIFQKCCGEELMNVRYVNDECMCPMHCSIDDLHSISCDCQAAILEFVSSSLSYWHIYLFDTKVHIGGLDNDCIMLTLLYIKICIHTGQHWLQMQSVLWPLHMCSPCGSNFLSPQSLPEAHTWPLSCL